MVIGICDDDKIWCNEAKRLIKEYTQQTLLEAEIYCFADQEALLSYSGAPLEVLFLDIELKSGSGLQTAEAVNRKWTRCQIVYLTNYLNYATEICDTKYVYFVMKEQFASRIGAIFGKIFHELEQHKKQLRFVCKGNQMICLAPEEIYYFERSKRKTILETIWGSYELYDRIDDLMKRLPSDEFIRCHNSYIIYLPNVKSAQKDAFCMKNGVNITVSRGYAKTTKAAFIRWILAQMN